MSNGFHENYSREHKVKMGSNKNFGYLFAVIFFTLSVWPLTLGLKLRFCLGALSFVFFAVTAFKAELLTPLNRGWMKFGLFLGRFLSPVILGVLYYGVFSTWGLLLRVFKKDLLNLKISNEQKTYWIKSDPNQTGSMKEQF